MPRRRYILYIALPVVAYVAVLGLLAALYLDLPTLGWIGLGVVVAVSCALVAGASYLFPRMRTNAEPVARPAKGTPRVFVLADARCTAPALCDAVGRHVTSQGGEVYVVAPVLPSALDYLSGDEAREEAEAGQRLAAVVERLEAAGFDAHGRIGVDDPLQALADAIGEIGPGDVVIAAPQESHWLEDDLLDRARAIAPGAERIVV